MATWTYTLIGPSPSVEALPEDVGPLTQTTDHAGTATDRLLEEFHHLPRFEVLLEDLVAMLQPIEDLAWDLLQERYLFTVNGAGPAIGEQLDGLGEILGEPRSGRGDDEYRTFLQIRILVNNSDGIWDDLHAILDLLPLVVHEAEEIYPAHIWIEANETDYGYQAWAYLREAKAAGVGLTMILSRFTAANVFTLGLGGEQQNAAKGLGGEYVSTGGRLAGVGR